MINMSKRSKSRQYSKFDEGGSSMFGRTYFSLCQLHSVPILTDLLTPPLESHHHLYLDVEKVKRDEDWGPILKALKTTRDLKHIYLYTNGDPHKAQNPALFQMQQRQPSSRTHETHRFTTEKQSFSILYRVLPNLIASVRECLVLNKNLTKLEIAGISLRETALNILSKGLLENKTLRELSLARTEIGDKGLIILAASLRTILYLQHLNLAACRLTHHGAAIVTSLFKSLAVRRQADKWAWSLRGGDEIADEDSLHAIHAARSEPRPLQRLNLSLNPIGDEGFRTLVDLIREEIGLLALDIQMTGLTDISGIAALQVFQTNQELLILDLRNNKIDDKILYNILDALSKNDERRKQPNSSSRISWDDNMPQMVWLDGKNPVKSTFHFTTATMRSKMHTHTSVKKKREIRSQFEPSRPSASPIKSSLKKRNADIQKPNGDGQRNRPLKSIIKNAPKRSSAATSSALKANVNIESDHQHFRSESSPEEYGISFIHYGTNQSANRPQRNDNDSLSYVIDSLKGVIDIESVQKETLSQSVRTRSTSAESEIQKGIVEESQRQNLQDENSKLKQRIDQLEELLVNVINQKQQHAPSHIPSQLQNHSDKLHHNEHGITESEEPMSLQVVQVESDRSKSNFSKAKAFGSNNSSSDEHLEMLIKLMEESLASFHDMLDRLDDK